EWPGKINRSRAMAITMMTKIDVRWRTDPGLVGYADSPYHLLGAVERLRASAPAFTGNAEQVVEYSRLIQNELGSTFSRWEFSDNSSGEIISSDDIYNLAERTAL